MELVEGDALDRLIGGQPMPIDRALEVARAVVDALMAAHDKGIVHRDLKPANVILSKSGQTKVLDFGLAKVNAGRPDTAKDSQTFLATEVGIVLGTPAYMSPEQVSGLDVDQRTDIFSFGVLLYEMLTGVRPFAGRSSAELATAILRDAQRCPVTWRESSRAASKRTLPRALRQWLTCAGCCTVASPRPPPTRGRRLRSCRSRISARTQTANSSVTALPKKS
jgi:serine/threonine protein kinase